MNEHNPPIISPAFYTDRNIARLLNVSPSWVRGQRMKRRQGQSHFLTLDPRLIGGAVRYVASEIDAFIASIAAEGSHA